eukprot:COSAG05_NODE_13205_length_438_cov_1.032448_1_plen_94_part_00
MGQKLSKSKVEQEAKERAQLAAAARHATEVEARRHELEGEAQRLELEKDRMRARDKAREKKLRDLVPSSPSDQSYRDRVCKNISKRLGFTLRF